MLVMSLDPAVTMAAVTDEAQVIDLNDSLPYLIFLGLFHYVSDDFRQI